MSDESGHGKNRGSLFDRASDWIASGFDNSGAHIAFSSTAEYEKEVLDNSVLQKQLMAGFVGNFMEFYDFSLYSGLAEILADQFFPNTIGKDALVLSYAIFGAAFLMRPIGAIFLGNIGDRYGRKRALQVSITFMLVSSLGMGLLPTYEYVSYFGAALLILLRLIQGLSAGGELPSVFTHISESASEATICCCMGFVVAGASLGGALAQVVVSVTFYCLNDDEMKDYGWRIPFLTNIVVGAVAIYIRMNLKDTRAFQKYNEAVYSGITQHPSFSTTVYRHWKAIGLLIFAGGVTGPIYYITMIWMPVYESSLLDHPMPNAQWVNIGILVLLSVACPLMGLVVDKIGAKWGRPMSEVTPIALMGSYLWIAIVAVPAFKLISGEAGISSTGYFPEILGQLLFVPPVAVILAVIGVFTAQQFPVGSRTMSTGISYNMSQCIFASWSLTVTTYMAENDGQSSPGYLVLGMCLACFIFLFFANQPLQNEALRWKNYDERLISKSSIRNSSRIASKDAPRFEMSSTSRASAFGRDAGNPMHESISTTSPESFSSDSTKSADVENNNNTPTSP